MTQTDLHPALSSYVDGGTKHMLIDGAFVPARSGETFDSINPSDGTVLASVAAGDAEDVDLAVRSARAALEGPWGSFTPIQRQNVLLRLADLIDEHYDELRYIESLDMGAPIGRASQADLIAQTLRYYAGWATKIHGETIPNSNPGSVFTYTLRQPVGVVAGIIPWNGPIGSSSWKIGPALAAGCTLILKPSEEASLAPLRLGELIQELDLPPGVINIVTGLGATAGAALTHHHDVDKVAFTGSTATGQSIVRAASGNLKRLTLELGGKSPDVIFADADLAAAIPGAGMGVFANSGQVCSAGTRVYVERPVYDEFVAGVSEFAGSLTVGHSLSPDTQIGPIVSQTQLDRVLGYLDAGQAEGGRVTAGGSRIETDDLAPGFFVPPTVFADVDDDMSIAREEIFGPVASIMPFDDVDDVMRRANTSDFALGAGVWTRDVGKAHRFAHQVTSGNVWVNTYGNLDAAVPFSGSKMSGWGSDLSGYALEGYLTVKSVWIDTGV